jgi:hypothetical protein
MKKDTIRAKVAGQKSKISRHYNPLIQKALKEGNTARAAAFKSAKTKKHNEVEAKYYVNA